MTTTVEYSKSKFQLNSPTSLLFAITGILVATLHLNVFYYSHDVLKWLVFDIFTTFYIAYSLRSRAIIQYSYIGILITALLYLMLISLWWAPHKVAGIEFLIRFTNSVLFAYCLIRNYDKDKLTNYLLNVVFWSSFVFCVVFIIERYGLNREYNLGSFSPIGFVNNTSSVFNIWIPGLVLYCVTHRHRPVLLGLGITTLLVIVSTLIYAGTRGAILGLGISELAIFTMALLTNRKQAFLFLSITVLLAIGIAIYNVFDSLQDGRLNEKLSLMKNNLGASTQARLAMYKNTWDMTVDNPLGIGINNFEYIHPRYARPGTELASPYVDENQILRTPHSIVLKITSELGFVGGLIFSALLLYLLSIALRNAWKGNYLDKWLFVAFSATLFHSLVDIVMLMPTSLFFFTFLSATIVARRPQSLVPRRQFSLRLPTFIKYSYLAIPILSVMGGTSEYFAFQGRTTLDGQLLERALRYNPQNDRALLDLSQFRLLRDKDVPGSLAALDRFLALYPYHIAALQMKAERHYQLNEFENAQQTLEKLLSFYPSYGRAQRLKQIVDIQIIRKKEAH